ncbi:zinc finger protein ZAT4 [Dendrobium catenatum]|uniref:zinc finger protein ZAT4 n=1 Tax=Dendrobium catenatum TaxID=906689 RepID=UPI0009F5D5FC|nr:zinc finger protein ZAT4 [Dendrobium catenatum]
MERHVCKLCDRSFSNGRALGGHMRSHVVAVAAAAAASVKSLLSDYSSSSTSSREAEEAKGLGYGLRENPKKSFRMVDPEFSSSVVQDRESETESSPITINRRRKKRPAPELPETELLSSVSDTTPEEDVAISLMLLSRDVWSKDEEVNKADERVEEMMMIDLKPRSLQAKGRSRFQCGTCKKVFRSYQALGGHRASHKKSRSCVPPIHVEGSTEANADADGKSVHVCPICFREFGCGQALGGHKRSHLSSSTTAITITSQPRPAKLSESLFDLNLPAPLEDAAELSAVSEAEFMTSGLA